MKIQTGYVGKLIIQKKSVSPRALVGTVRDNLHVATQGCMFFQGDHHLCNAPILKNANGFFRVHKSGKIMLIYLWVTIAHAQKANQALLNSGQNLRLLR